MPISKWWPAAPEQPSLDSLNGGLKAIYIPLLQERGAQASNLHQHARQRSRPSLEDRLAAAAAPSLSYSSSSDDETLGPASYRVDRVGHDHGHRRVGVGAEHEHEHRRQRSRSFTSEFGTSSETNPALFASSSKTTTTTRKAAMVTFDRFDTFETQASEGAEKGSMNRGSRRPRASGRGHGGHRVVDSLNTGGHRGTVGTRGSLNDPGSVEGFEGWGVREPNEGGGGGEELRMEGGAASRRWFDDPQDYEGDEETSMFLREESIAHGSAGKSKSSGRGAEGVKKESLLLESSLYLGEIHTPLAGPSPDRHAVLGGNVVEGYVSLGPSLQRQGSSEHSGGGLLLAGPPDDDGGVRDGDGVGSFFCGGSEGGLSTFREQLYEEGRCKGNLASR